MLDDADATAILTGMVTISRTFRKAAQRSRERSLAGTKYGFLRHLLDGDARLGELAHHLIISAPVASRAVEALEADALVERRTDPLDARAILISITEQGRTALAEGDSRIIRKFAVALDDWTPEEAERAISLLNVLNERLADVLQPSETPADAENSARPDSTTTTDTLTNKDEKENNE
ncbi:MarR family winged helix-turn-helix transcriptional regulator [Salinibacterium sp. M195]|uniref:MarR family winged helix-turn-helix transcriptional regulator n=1 Tax=Salinibacterium sp. M195 TaxID=2583374 RepID=UPI001C63939D|nr:MarR family winged helix-turn-helix transcriptional regulator [Salinibacterium sp. M195]QYH34557.1 winged helix-turn-helix transcriptional regulator [Salinibacterium sp. M195]